MALTPKRWTSSSTTTSSTAWGGTGERGNREDSMAENPFSQHNLDALFETVQERPDLLKRRESTTLEIKENFQRNNFPDYGRTLAAFANRSGGYILFGVKNQPHLLVGMTNNQFMGLDPNALTQFLNNHFSPSLHWDHLVHTFEGKDFGLIYAHPAMTKPVVCSRTANPLRDGDIYYRYQGETRLISSGDLHGLIEERVESERRSWRGLLQRAAHVSPTATYLLDIQQGRAQGDKRTFVIGEELLNKVKFIHEGRFSEEGEPTLKVVGDVEVVRTEVIAGATQLPPVDPTKECTLYENVVVIRLQERIGANIPFGDGRQKLLNGVHVRSVVKAHGIPTPSQYYYRPEVPGSRAYYGEPLVDWIESQYRLDPQFFFKAYEAARNRGNSKSPAK